MIAISFLFWSGELRLFPVAVKGPAGEHVDLQVSLP